MGSSVGEKNGRSNGNNPNGFDKDKGLQILLKDLKALQQEGGKNGDLKFTLKDGAHAKAHSLIINARCKNFKGELNFGHISLESFSLFLTYVYTGKLKMETPQALYPLYLLSLDFGLENLTTVCEETMISNMDINSALQILQEAVTSLDTLQIPPTANLNTTNIISNTSNKESISGVKSAIKKFTFKSEDDNEEISNPNSCGPIQAKVQRLIDTCITHLSESNNSSGTKLKKNANFLNLSVETMKIILNSEHLCLAEEEVWRCVLKWAQSKGNVEASRHVSQWNEEERLKVSEFLSPVISHVKLLLIDSRVFAEEVEPTGCVPMALSLERYRTAALSSFDHEQGGGSDPKLRPRNAQKLFHSSLIINSERVALGKKLQEWFASRNPTASNTNWKLVYRASQHGFSSEDFHSRVDGQGPHTFVIVLLKNSKWVCGGYTDVPWNSAKSPKYVSSSKSFLFASNPTTNGVPVMFDVIKKHFAVCHDSNSGPIFGAGSDLYISSFCGSNSDSYSNLPHSYEIRTSPPDSSLGGCSGSLELPVIGSIAKKDKLQDFVNDGASVLSPSYNFTVADYEVFVQNL